MIIDLTFDHFDDKVGCIEVIFKFDMKPSNLLALFGTDIRTADSILIRLIHNQSVVPPRIQLRFDGAEFRFEWPAEWAIVAGVTRTETVQFRIGPVWRFDLLRRWLDTISDGLNSYSFFRNEEILEERHKTGYQTKKENLHDFNL